MPSTLIHGATVLTVDAADHTYADGWIAIRDGRISGVGPRDTQPDRSLFDEDIELPGHLVMPGLVNAHTHSAMILFRGRAEGQSLLTMDGWYNAIREPELSLQAGDIGPAVALSCAEMALSGTTTFCDQYFFRRRDCRGCGAGWTSCCRCLRHRPAWRCGPGGQGARERAELSLAPAVG